jgi:PIN domain nuclease of toxin-antitoxin system
MTFLDTHAVAWLYAGEIERFTDGGRRRIEEDDLVVSPMVELELQYLRETGRLTVDAAGIVDFLARSIGLRVDDEAFPDVVRESLIQSWARDPFDRLIAAQAALRAAPLLTKDRTIRRHYPRAVW